MHEPISFKNHKKEIQLITRRSMLFLSIGFALIIVLILRLAYLQIYKHDVYITLATKNWLDLVPVEPTRGLIFDRNGLLLAENIPVFSLDIVPVQVTDLQKTLTALGKIISITKSDAAQFQRQLKQHRRFDEIPLKLRLSEDEAARFTENQHQFLGVMIKARLMRRYPYGESFSHVLGYVGRINTQELTEIDPINYSASHYIGKSGIEKFYEEELHGKVGYEEVENDASGKPIRVLKEIKGMPGKNIYLTLDSGLQFIAERALAGHRGAVVVIQPATGQVLAMVSQPGYDPNLFVLGISQKDYIALQKSPDRPLYDRAFRGLYPLASTIKPYLALKALDMGIITPELTIYDPGWFQLRNYSKHFRDWERRGHGRVNLNRAIASSCDTYFYELGTKLGIRRISEVLFQFGFGGATGIDLEDEPFGIVANPQWKKKVKHAHWYDGDTVISSIGQGSMLATPLQLAQAVSTIANRGERYVPYLLLAEQTPGKPMTAVSPAALTPVVLNDKKIWEIIINAMQEVTSSPQGTAYWKYGQHHPYTLAAKTGTAQIISSKPGNEVDNQNNLPEKLRDHHLFVAFAPVENPQIAIGIITENSNMAVEAARLIFDYYLMCPKDRRNVPDASILNGEYKGTCEAVIRDLANYPGNEKNADRQPETQTQKTNT